MKLANQGDRILATGMAVLISLWKQEKLSVLELREGVDWKWMMLGQWLGHFYDIGGSSTLILRGHPYIRLDSRESVTF